MEKTIYLPSSARKQLETSDNASVWTRKIPYSNTPSERFTFSYTFDPDDEDDEGIDPTDGKYFYPDKTNPDIALERLVEVSPAELKKSAQSAVEARQALVGAHPDAIYRCFLGAGGDAECWARYQGGEIEVFSQHVYTFSGLGQVPSSTRRQEKCLDIVLTQGAGLALNRTEVKLCDGSYDSQFSQRDPKFAFTANDLVSVDGKTYKLFQDHDDGARGYALFTVKPKKRVAVIFEDHCDNVRDWMLEDNLAFLKGLGLKVNFKSLDRHNHEFHTDRYAPTPKDFEEDFHLNEKGRKKKA